MNELAPPSSYRSGELARPLDPFEFYPGRSSAIAGLGGDGAAPDPLYAFHTAYAEVRHTGAAFRLRLEGLRAAAGTLVLHLNRLPYGASTVARVVAQRRIALADLAAQGGTAEIAFDGVDDAAYALVGLIEAGEAVAADALTVELLGALPDTDRAAALVLARETILSAASEPRLAPLFAAGPATLADPVSQACTAAQFEEPEFAEWIARLRMPHLLHRKYWEFAYVLQALRRYGALRPGARGLGFGVGQEALPALMAALGASVLATDLPPDHADARVWHDTGQHVAAADALRRPEICPDDLFDSRVSFRPVDMTAIPTDLRGFDFCWSSCAFEHLGSIAAGLRFVEESIGCLTPGGLAVHTTELNLSSNTRTLDHAGTVLFRRADMEELVLRLVAAGHAVAPIRLDLGDRPLDAHVDVPPYSLDPHLKIAIGRFTTTSFGLIVRRGAA